MDCIFCKIINGDIKSERIYENEKILAFADINPISPVHILVIPKKHIEGLDYLDNSNAGVMADIFLAINECAKLKSIDKSGFRVIINTGKDSGQDVFHIHAHLLGGVKLGPMLSR
jgi:histidine triad (HIT) family protein